MMAPKRRKPGNIGKPRPSPTRGRRAKDDDRPKSGVMFELEDDAEALFLKEFEGLTREAAEEFAEQPKARPVPKGRSKKKAAPPLMVEIDLHHHTREQAEQALSRRLEELRSLHHEVKVRIITGKGRRSKDGKGVLVRTIHSFVVSRFKADIASIQPCPSDSTVDGRPVRGYFDVVFKF